MSETSGILDVFLRGGAVTALLACAALFSVRLRPTRKSLSVAAFCVGLCCYLLVSSPHVPVPAGSTAAILIGLARFVPILGYWASHELFVDEVSFARWQIAVGFVVIAGAWLPPAVPFADLTRGIAVIILFSHLAFVVVASGDGDLVEERRQFRKWFLLMMAAAVIVITGLELTGQDDELPDWAFAIHAAAFLCFATAFLVWAVRPVSEIWPSKPDAPDQISPGSPADELLAGRAQSAMDEGLWQEEGLTIAQLAAHLETREHRLRRAINKELGFRNFPSFVNSYRIEQARLILTDPMKLDYPIQSVAYDVGFSSIGPFNRAFRAAQGMSPTEFRKRTLKDRATSV
ncbi:helix-turn-helix domain-containing protein [Epibacterium sp. Ofav1-8]|uniref:helix-turn-helix domain-containing protein n=1 Tax=Epibacterium sp. Ofav1-8 TaxID=2917735 RepID=UPI001EF45D04|nr:AraC family transcriptional regulator [Epibacterium sp. Ofav1-8]MCG7625142.1 AraC family transcriptional regulator [Epibacterium sp. Ofav1-8]